MHLFETASEWGPTWMLLHPKAPNANTEAPEHRNNSMYLEDSTVRACTYQMSDKYGLDLIFFPYSPNLSCF